MNWISHRVAVLPRAVAPEALRSRAWVRWAMSLMELAGIYAVRAGRHHSGRKLVWGAPRHRPDAFYALVMAFSFTTSAYARFEDLGYASRASPGLSRPGAQAPDSAGKTQPRGTGARVLSDSICADRSQEGPGGLVLRIFISDEGCKMTHNDVTTSSDDRDEGEPEMNLHCRPDDSELIGRTPGRRIDEFGYTVVEMSSTPLPRTSGLEL